MRWVLGYSFNSKVESEKKAKKEKVPAKNFVTR